MKCNRCGCQMTKAMKGVGPQVWVCSNLECRHLEVESKGGVA